MFLRCTSRVRATGAYTRRRALWTRCGRPPAPAWWDFISWMEPATGYSKSNRNRSAGSYSPSCGSMLYKSATDNVDSTEPQKSSQHFPERVKIMRQFNVREERAHDTA